MKFQLRQWRTEDATDLAHYANNKKIADHLRNGFPHPYTLEDANAYIESCIGAPQQLTYAIEVQGKAAGSIGVFFGNDVYCRSAELGYWLAEPFWGKGIMTEAVRQICGEAFAGGYGLVRIFAEPYAYNIGSRRVLEHAGFQLEGILRSSVWKNERLVDSCMYALLKAEDKKISSFTDGFGGSSFADQQ